MTDVPLQEAQGLLSSLVQRTASTRERVTITEDGHAAAVLMNPEELLELEEELAIQRYLVQKAEGTLVRIPHAEAMARLGLTARASTERV
jgi:PHD/YefM family antitoxin component YafN of YafNO toxin-antitoxin module